MAALGEMFPGRKLTKDDLGSTGQGKLLPPGPLDLDSGVVVLNKRSATPDPAVTEDEATDDSAS